MARQPRLIIQKRRLSNTRHGHHRQAAAQAAAASLAMFVRLGQVNEEVEEESRRGNGTVTLGWAHAAACQAMP